MIKYILAILFLLVSCSRKVNLEREVNVVVPNGSGTTQSVYQQGSVKLQSANQWGGSAISSLSQAECYGLFVEGPNFNSGSCSNGNTEKFKFGKAFGLIKTGTNLSLKLKINEEYVFRLVALKKINPDSDCENFETSTPNLSMYSKPRIVDIETVKVSENSAITLSKSFLGAEFDKCEGGNDFSGSNPNTDEGNETGNSCNDNIERIYVIGGKDSIGNDSNIVWTSQEGSTWTTIGTLPVARSGGSAVSFNNSLYYIGGGNSNTVWESDAGVSWSAVGALPASRELASVGIFLNKIWFIAGFGDGNKEVYSTIDGLTWTTPLTSAPDDAMDGHSTVIFNNKIWVLGGRRQTGGATTNRVYSSTDGVNWISEGTLPGPRRFGAATIYNNKIWYVGGEDNLGNPTNTVWSSSDGSSWTTEGSIPANRLYGSLITFNGKIWVIGGTAGPGGANEVWSSTSGASWTLESYLPNGRYLHSVITYTCN